MTRDIMLADWIASNVDFYPNEENDDDFAAYIIGCRKEAKLIVESIGFITNILPEPTSIFDLYGWDETFARPMQQLANEVTKDFPKFVLIEESPGAGKTEAATYLALSMAKHYNKEGLYFALPTAATSNQMWTRMQETFSKYDVNGFRLLHGMAWSVVGEDSKSKHKYGSESAIGNEWLNPSRKALLSQFAVGTVDQIMMAVLKIKFRQLRMFGLSNKVIIIDEVHAYDTYMTRIIDRLLEWCASLNIPVVMLSATLPRNKKIDYFKAYSGRTYAPSDNLYPLMTYIDENNTIIEKGCESFRKSRYDIQTLPYLNDINATAELALQLARKGGNICLMANTVRDAQAIYNVLSMQINKKEKIKLLLYHARFKTKDRAKIEQKCLKWYSGTNHRPEKSILVCTQVVEQSLDVDFDVLITQICPIDLLVQRLGREWRHQRYRPEHIKSPKVYILTGDVSKSPMKKVYNSYIIAKTEEYLSSITSINLPENLRTAISAVYDDFDGSKACLDKYFEDTRLAVQADGSIIGEPDEDEYYLVETDVFEALDDTTFATTRLGKNTIKVALCTNTMLGNFRAHPNWKKYQNIILKNSLSVNADIPVEQLESHGVLKGMLLVSSNDDRYIINDNITIYYTNTGAEIIYKNGKN